MTLSGSPGEGEIWRGLNIQLIQLETFFTHSNFQAINTQATEIPVSSFVVLTVSDASQGRNPVWLVRS